LWEDDVTLFFYERLVLGGKCFASRLFEPVLMNVDPFSEVPHKITIILLLNT
jgi:hypothetical protein